MMRMKFWFVVVLLSSLMACASTPKELEKEKNDKEAARINVKLASGYIRRGDLQFALEKLKKAIEYDDQYAPGFTSLAVLMTMMDRPVEAENYYLEALNIDPRDPNLHNNYGTFLCGIKKYDEAIDEFEATLRNQFYKTPEVAHANIGYCILQSEKPDYKKAEKHLRKALKRKPNMPTAMLAMGELGVATKNYLMARAYTQRLHSIQKPTSASMWVQIQAEHALGDKKYFLQVSRKLLDQFPDSKEADKLMELSNL
ncbi:MAG: type IV pilus biogenesis/stability protein PilW [endosymbiont of Galathealinum brachiosum]|uniref:Type IV pilus biogenesis/stability protein PilW n=1 Tax=endosymbiont of Galathealinum brachiosum TaxID=2200906 RepID=A0A370DFK2_9GAMM|nr:MAG: type IV pilus biogenesis/stability protein PilW [endosymbiont of Galathealinum brachiosum]